MSLSENLVRELEAERETTRRVLERVPTDRLDWRPHPKARTLGELALHVAIVPGAVAELGSRPSPTQAPTFGADPVPNSAAELLPALDQSIAKATQIVGAMNDATLTETWQLVQGDREIFAVPRISFLRSVMLNHWYHHRGQLTVYLRLAGATVPAIYGQSADDPGMPDVEGA